MRLEPWLFFVGVVLHNCFATKLSKRRARARLFFYVLQQNLWISLVSIRFLSVVGAGAKLDRDGSKLDSGDGAKLDFWGFRSKRLVLGGFDSRVGHRPQDTALPEGNRSGGRCQRGCGLGVAARIAHAGTFLTRTCPLTKCAKLRRFGGSAPMFGGCRGSSSQPMLPGVQRNSSLIACRPISSAGSSRISTPAHWTLPVPPPAWA